MAIDDTKAAVDALLKEYNNLWNEKLLHIGVIANNFRIMAKYTKSDSDLSATMSDLSGCQEMDDRTGVSKMG